MYNPNKLIQAIRAGDVEKVKKLLKTVKPSLTSMICSYSNYDYTNYVTYNNNASLHLAATLGFVDILDQLLQIPAIVTMELDPRVVNKSLHAAIGHYQPKAVVRLLQVPELRETANLEENRALMLSVRHNQPTVFHELLQIFEVQQTSAKTAVIEAAITDHLGMFLYLRVTHQAIKEDSSTLLYDAFRAAIANTPKEKISQREVIKYLLNEPESLNVITNHAKRLLQQKEFSVVDRSVLQLLNIVTPERSLLRNEM